MAPRKTSKVQVTPIHPLAIHKHIKRHFAKHAKKVVHAYNSLSHKFAHLGELVVVLLFCVYGALFAANFTGNVEQVRRDSSSEVAAALANAITHPEDILTKGNLISVWNINTSVYTSFSTGYCTYGAARISPEFFPYVDSKTQMRTWWGNAVDRCENAAATGFKVWLTPSIGSLVVYNGGGKFGPYGHVGKVVYYDRWLNKIIVRDMNRVGLFTMSDHWADADDSSFKCFIYPSKTVSAALPDSVDVIDTSTGKTIEIVETPTIPTPPQVSTWKVITGVSHGTSTGTIQPPVVVKTGSTTTGTISPGKQTPTTPETPIIITPSVSTQDVELDFDEASDLAQHLASQRDISAQVIGKKTMSIGDTTTLTLSVKDKKTQQAISGLLPLKFALVSSRDTIVTDYLTISFLQNGEISIQVKAIKSGTSTLLLNFGDDTIGKITISVK